jgi:hypothetical protein
MLRRGGGGLSRGDSAAPGLWVPLSYRGEWRWLTEREDSPWYPTLRLFRQAHPGDWAGVVARIQLALREVSVQNQRHGR